MATLEIQFSKSFKSCSRYDKVDDNAIYQIKKERRKTNSNDHGFVKTSIDCITIPCELETREEEAAQ